MSGELLTKEQVEKAVPANAKGMITQALVDHINNIVTDPLVAEQVRNNFVSYTSVLKDGKFKIDEYLHAVMYVSYKLMGLSNVDAYERTFPQRWAVLQAKGTTPKDISAYVSAYNKGKLVNLILEQTIVPSWVLNADAFQRAVNTQLQIMTDANVSAKVRSDAANSLMTHLQRPKEANVIIPIKIEESSGMNELKGLLDRLVNKQIDSVQNGVPIKDIAGQKIIDVEPEDE